VRLTSGGRKISSGEFAPKATASLDAQKRTVLHRMRYVNLSSCLEHKVCPWSSSRSLAEQWR
jgi:hypothetical protein